jgi:drug/metabolite transporter (DMT)-like permease
MLNKTEIERYFTSEKQIGILFLVIGVLAFGAALFFFFSNKTTFYKGFSIPVILFSLVFLYAGFSLSRNADTLKIKNIYAFDMKPNEIGEKELPRMQKLLKDLAVYRLIEIGSLVAGVLILLIFRSKPDMSGYYGFGVALAITAIVAHGLDFVAKKNARDYAAKVEAFVKK